LTISFIISLQLLFIKKISIISLQFDPCRIELWGKDPWVSSSDPLKVDTILQVGKTFYSVQNLEPYTTYLLKVFLMNDAGLYNKEVRQFF